MGRGSLVIVFIVMTVWVGICFTKPTTNVTFSGFSTTTNSTDADTAFSLQNLRRGSGGGAVASVLADVGTIAVSEGLDSGQKAGIIAGSVIGGLLITFACCILICGCIWH